MPVDPAGPALKRKASSSESSDEDADPSSLVKGRGGSELVPSTKPGEPPVTKRTLQNSKSQHGYRNLKSRPTYVFHYLPISQERRSVNFESAERPK